MELQTNLYFLKKKLSSKDIIRIFFYIFIIEYKVIMIYYIITTKIK